MGISAYNIKRWTAMLLGKSVYHVDQSIGKAIGQGGYYNDLTKKVTLGGKDLDENGIPVLEHSDGRLVHMPTMVFQYGLGAYDLWLMENNGEDLQRAVRCADWALAHQNADGSWDNFSYIYPDAPFSAMPQGEGASLLLRVFRETGEPQYRDAAKRAIDFMLKDRSDGGVCERRDGCLYLYEFTNLPLVLNGWVFAWFGLYDMAAADEAYRSASEQCVRGILRALPEFDVGYWSGYNEAGLICSPFYHNLQIAQMQAMYLLTKEDAFRACAQRWERFQKDPLKKARAFIVKAVQKIRE